MSALGGTRSATGLQSILRSVAAVCDRRFCRPIFAGPSCSTHAGKNQRRLQNPTTKVALLRFCQTHLFQSFTAEAQKRRESVWRAVHCAPEPLALAQPIGLNLDYPRPHGRGYERVGKARTPLRAESRRAEDYPPYQCNCYGAWASTPAELHPG